MQSIPEGPQTKNRNRIKQSGDNAVPQNQPAPPVTFASPK